MLRLRLLSHQRKETEKELWASEGKWKKSRVEGQGACLVL